MKYWVFDLDGTLVDSHGLYFETLQKLIQEYGSSFDGEDMKHVLSISAKDLGPFFKLKLGEEKGQQAFLELQKRAHEDSARTPIFEGIDHLLQSLEEEGSRVALWTARDLESALAVLESTSLRKYFSICISGTCVASGKPHPEGLVKIAEHFGCSPDELIHVGDHDHDVHGAKACGAKAIRASWHRKDSAEACSVSDLQFYDVQDLHRWVLEI